MNETFLVWLFPVSLEVGLEWTSIFPALGILFLLFLNFSVVRGIARETMAVSEETCSRIRAQREESLEYEKIRAKNTFLWIFIIGCACWFFILWPAESNISLAKLKHYRIPLFLIIMCSYFLVRGLFSACVDMAGAMKKPKWSLVAIFLALSSSILSCLLVSQIRGFYYATTLPL